jgi:hypothetical protein
MAKKLYAAEFFPAMVFGALADSRSPFVGLALSAMLIARGSSRCTGLCVLAIHFLRRGSGFFAIVKIHGN